MPVDISQLFQARLARNKGLVPGQPDAECPATYGVSATMDGSEISLTLTFLAGIAYCCMEWHCHTGLSSHKRWDWIRQHFSRSDFSPERLSIKLTVVIEDGAMFFDFSRPRYDIKHGWYEFAPHCSRQYSLILAEGAD